MILNLRGEEIELLPEKAFLWKKQKILGFSDVHLGKAESFQAAGIPVPSGVHEEDLEQMSALLEKHDVDKVFVLGDWIHRNNSWTDDLVKRLHKFFKRHEAVKWTLIIGNHERGSRARLQEFPMELVEEHLRCGPFTFAHGHETQTGETFVISGHVHPVIVLRDGPVRLRLPCFVCEENSLLLPSFGKFTGGFEITPRKNQRLFATTNKKVIEIP